MYHAWLVVCGRILDFTTHLLRQKASAMDAADGRKTTVLWCPDYLLADKSQVCSAAQVLQDRAGLFYYERVPALEAKARAEEVPVPEDEKQALWLIYQSPEVIVFGPNSLTA
jgi:hypothetical protein